MQRENIYITTAILHFVGTTWEWCNIWKSLKLGKHCFHGHLAGTVPEVCKIAENAKYGNV